jgi:hypothetical protein
MTLKSHHCSSALLALIAFSAFAIPAHAQQIRLRPQEIGQIADEVILALVPPSTALSRVEVGKRKIFFDRARTLTAFGYAGGSGVIPLRTHVQAGSEALLDDCNQIQKLSCSKLGWGVYIFLQPISINDSEAVVLAHVRWPDRGFTVFEPGIPPNGGASLYGFSEEMHFRRSCDGTWRFEKRGKIAVS